MLQIICRTCLALEGEFSSIYDSKGSNCVANMVGDITSHTPKKSDGMPEMVCLACIQEIKRCYLFKSKCLSSESVLKQLLYSCQDTTLEKNVDVVARDCTPPKEQVDIPDVVDEKAIGEPYIVIDLKDVNKRLEVKHEVEKQMLLHYTNEEDENAANAVIPLEKKENAELKGRKLSHVDTPDVEFVENEKVLCVVIDSDEESESLTVEHQVEKHLELLNGEHVNMSNPIENNQNPKSKECVLPHIETPDIEFVETAKETYVVVDSDEESSVLEIEHEGKKHGELLSCYEDRLILRSTPIEIERNPDSTECIPAQDDTPDVEFVENDKVPCVVIDSEGESEHMETENEVGKDVNSTRSNKGNENVAFPNALMKGKPSAATTGCILPREQDDTQDVDFAKTEDEPYVVIDLECESERLEIKHEVQKHLRVLYINKENKNGANADVLIKEMRNVEPRACIPPQVDELDVEIVELNKETCIVVDSEDETVQFEIEHDVKEHSTPIIRQYHPRKTKGLLKVKKKLKPSVPMIQSAEENSKVSELNRQTQPSEISDDFSQNFDDFEGESDQDCSVDFAPPARRLQCTKCAMKILDPTNLREHVCNCEITMHQCPVCQECFAHRLLLTHHMRLHPGGLRHGENKPNKCKMCPRSFYSIKELRLHVRGHIGDSPIACDPCQPSRKSDKDVDCRETDRYSDRKEDRVIQAKDESDANAIIDDTASSSSTQTKDRMNDNGELDEQANDDVRQLCSYCGAGFEKRTPLEAHTNQLKCSTKPFVCSQCKCQRFSYPKKDISRVDMPTCDICHLVLPNGEDLLNHNLETHNVKSQCPIYKKNLQTMSAVKVLMRRHKNEEPYVCPVCGRAFASRGWLSHHMLQHRIAKPFNSEKCPHFRRHTGELPYACPLCPKRYAASSGCRTYEARLARTKSCDFEMQEGSAEEPRAECMDVDKDDAVSEFR